MRCVDLFAGAGGFSEGARLAGAEIVWAGNHWPLAVQYHTANFPATEHVCQDLHQAQWHKLPRFDVLLASPCCQGHSHARGKDRPEHETRRSTAWAVVSCAEHHRPELVIVENTPEFQDWVLYPVWADAMQRLGYAVSPHILDAADHGVPQNRVRLFIVCSRSKTPINLRLEKREHVPASSIIEWDAFRWSRIDRPGRSQATLDRVAHARLRGLGQRFLFPFYSSGSGKTGRSLDRPLGTITTLDRWAITDGDQMRMLQPSELRLGMGFRRDYLLPKTRREAIHLLGNAVPPPVVTDILTELKKAA